VSFAASESERTISFKLAAKTCVQHVWLAAPFCSLLCLCSHSAPLSSPILFLHDSNILFPMVGAPYPLPPPPFNKVTQARLDELIRQHGISSNTFISAETAWAIAGWHQDANAMPISNLSFHCGFICNLNDHKAVHARLINLVKDTVWSILVSKLIA